MNSFNFDVLVIYDVGCLLDRDVVHDHFLLINHRGDGTCNLHTALLDDFGDTI
jgi:hypothetical protein